MIRTTIVKRSIKPPERKTNWSVRGALDRPRVLSWGAVGLFLGTWELAAAAAHVSPLYLPRPSAILVELIDMFAHDELATDLCFTLYRIFAGFFIALLVGVALGVWIASSWRAQAVADIFIAALYPLPKVTLIPLLIIWLGTGGPFMLTISFLGAVFPIVINTAFGVRRCDPGLIMAARDLNASQRQIVRRVLIPSAVPAILTGSRLGLGVTIVLVVAAEMVVGKNGLGARLYLSGQILETGQVFAVLLLLAALGILVSVSQDVIETRLGRWSMS